MFTVIELSTGRILSVDQTKLLIYCRQFDNGFVVYEEILKIEPNQVMRVNETHIFAKLNNSPIKH